MKEKETRKAFCNTTIPSDWKVMELEDLVISITNGATYDPDSREGFPITRIETIAGGTINIDKVGLTPYLDSLEKYKLKKGDILYSHINSVAHIGKTAYCERDYDILHGMNLLRIKPKSSIDSSFFFYLLNSKYGRKQAYETAKRAVNQASLSTSEIKHFEFPIPPLPEQKAIANILSLVDTAINNNNFLLAKKELQKKWLMQLLLTGKKRLRGFGKEKWEIKFLDDILIPVRISLIPKSDELYQQIGIRSHTKGLFYKEKVTGEILGDKRVFWIEPNCFIVNIVFAWEQAIAKTTDKEIGMIASHRFPMFKSKEGVLDIDYLLNYFKSTRGKYLLGLASPGGAGRNKTLGQSEFMTLQIPTPPLMEQTAIVKVLQAADKEIQLLKTKTEKLRQQKKGMMQVLLTGKKRLKTSSK